MTSASCSDTSTLSARWTASHPSRAVTNRNHLLLFVKRLWTSSHSRVSMNKSPAHRTASVSQNSTVPTASSCAVTRLRKTVSMTSAATRRGCRSASMGVIACAASSMTHVRAVQNKTVACVTTKRMRLPRAVAKSASRRASPMACGVMDRTMRTTSVVPGSSRRLGLFRRAASNVMASIGRTSTMKKTTTPRAAIPGARACPRNAD
mmetsp:Transcript_25187/g.95181  ORF Transcript_25187/g.95181 Transcript_25187/m.95181 type:complete len:206 (+) Transcript_25187:1452-2069(+)